MVDFLATFGHARGAVGPILFYNKDAVVVVDPHADDFHITGPQQAMAALLPEPGRHLLIQPGPSYIEKTLDDLTMQGCRRVYTPSLGPIEPPGLLDGDEEQIEDLAPGALYRRCAGRLLCISNYRIDISWTVMDMPRFLTKPTIQAMKALRRLARYLSGRRTSGSSSRLHRF